MRSMNPMAVVMPNDGGPEGPTRPGWLGWYARETPAQGQHTPQQVFFTPAGQFKGEGTVSYPWNQFNSPNPFLDHYKRVEAVNTLQTIPTFGYEDRAWYFHGDGYRPDAQVMLQDHDPTLAGWVAAYQDPRIYYKSLYHSFPYDQTGFGHY